MHTLPGTVIFIHMSPLLSTKTLLYRQRSGPRQQTATGPDSRRILGNICCRSAAHLFELSSHGDGFIKWAEIIVTK